MLWRKRNKAPEPIGLDAEREDKREAFPFPERHCWLYVSSKYKEVIFVPIGKIDPCKSKELEAVVVKEWPMNVGDLQECIQETLDRWQDSVIDTPPSKENWHSFTNSKAKTQKSFKADYVQIRLTTDTEAEYGRGEAERIIVKATPFDWVIATN